MPKGKMVIWRIFFKRNKDNEDTEKQQQRERERERKQGRWSISFFPILKLGKQLRTTTLNDEEMSIFFFFFLFLLLLPYNNRFISIPRTSYNRGKYNLNTHSYKQDKKKISRSHFYDEKK